MKKILLLLTITTAVLHGIENQTPENKELETFISTQKASPEFIDAWRLTQNQSILDLVTKIKKIESCSNCSLSEKKFFIDILIAPTTPLIKFISINLRDKYKLRLGCGASYCTPRDNSSILARMLSIAIVEQRKDLVELLLDFGAKIRSNPATIEPILEAIKAGNIEVGETALAIAKQQGNLFAIKTFNEAIDATKADK